MSWSIGIHRVSEQPKEDVSGQLADLFRRLVEVAHEGVGSEGREVEGEGHVQMPGRLTDPTCRGPRQTDEVAHPLSPVVMSEPVDLTDRPRSARSRVVDVPEGFAEDHGISLMDSARQSA